MLCEKIGVTPSVLMDENPNALRRLELVYESLGKHQEVEMRKEEMKAKARV